jgi:hypothetical protein
MARRADAGLILVRELDERLGFSGLIAQPAAPGPTPGGRTPSCLVRIPQGGTQRLSQDPTPRLIGSEKIWERRAALTPRLSPLSYEV